MTDRDFATEVVRTLQVAGHETYFAGGCVRDELLGLEPDDYDVATAATPGQVRKLFRRTIAVGASFGVIEVLGPRPHPQAGLSESPRAGKFLKVQVATFRSDGTYSDGRRPDSVVFSSAEEDAKRRDFTINGMFADPIAGRVIDFVGGRDDLKAGVLRAIGDPAERIAEDKLRLLRAVRMATRFGLRLEERTRDAVAAMAGQINVVSAERIAEEFRKMLLHPRRADAVRLLDGVGLLAAIRQLGDPKTAAGERWDHTLAMLDALERPTFPLALAVVLYPMGARRVAQVGRDLKLSNEERERAEWLVGHAGALRDAESLPRSRLYPLLVKPGIGELIALHRAESEASGEVSCGAAYCERLLRTTPGEELDPPPLLTGDDLKDAGLEPGPEFKRMLDRARAAQLDGVISTPEAALRLALEYRQV